MLNSTLSFADMKCQLALSINKMQSILFIEQAGMSNLQIKAFLGRVVSLLHLLTGCLIVKSAK